MLASLEFEDVGLESALLMFILATCLSNMVYVLEIAFFATPDKMR